MVFRAGVVYFNISVKLRALSGPVLKPHGVYMTVTFSGLAFAVAFACFALFQ